MPTAHLAPSDILAHWSAMVRVARTVVDTADDAQECAAEAVAQVLSQTPIMVDNLEAYLVTVAKRRALDMRRSRDRERRRHTLYAAETTITALDVAEDVVLKAEARWADLTARQLLTPRAYQILRMVADDVPIGHIAEELELSVPAVHAHLLRARRTMRAALGRALALFGLLGLGLRRLVAGSAPVAATSLAAALLITLPGSGAWPGGRPPAPANRGTGRLPAAGDGNLGPTREVVAGSRLVPASQAHRPSRMRSTATAPAPPIASMHGPAGASATVTAGDSGTHEDGPAQEVLACLNNVQVNWQHVGC